MLSQTVKHVRIYSWAEHLTARRDDLECTECGEPILAGENYTRQPVRTLLESGQRTVIEVQRVHECCPIHREY